MPYQLFVQKMLKLSRNSQNIKMFGVPQNTRPLIIYIGMYNMSLKTIAGGFNVFSDGMVHFLKIENFF